MPHADTPAVHDLTARLQAAASGTADGLRRGLWLSFLDPYGLEVAIGCGADWVGVDLQHGNLEPHDLPALLRVTEPAGLPLLARTPSHDPAILARILDTGVSGLIVPMVESPDQARALVSRDPHAPTGRPQHRRLPGGQQGDTRTRPPPAAANGGEHSRPRPRG